MGIAFGPRDCGEGKLAAEQSNKNVRLAPVKKNRAHAARGIKRENAMKYIITLALFLAQAASAADGLTPTLIKAGINADLFYQNGYPLATMTYYTYGVMESIKSILALGLVPGSICFPANGNIDWRGAMNAMDPAKFPDTNQGGTLYIFSSLAAKYPC